VFFRAISTETVPNVTGHHFLTFFAPSYFLITNMRVATEEFFSVMHSCCCLTGLGLTSLIILYSLGLGLNISVLFPPLPIMQLVTRHYHVSLKKRIADANTKMPRGAYSSHLVE